jgi:hypothetical protein
LRVILRREFVGLVEGEGAVIRGETAMVSKIGGRRSGDVIAFRVEGFADREGDGGC